MSAVIGEAFNVVLIFVGMSLYITGLLAMAGGNNMERIGLSTPRRGMIAMIVGLSLFSIGVTRQI